MSIRTEGCNTPFGPDIHPSCLQAHKPFALGRKSELWLSTALFQYTTYDVYIAMSADLPLYSWKSEVKSTAKVKDNQTFITILKHSGVVFILQHVSFITKTKRIFPF